MEANLVKRKDRWDLYNEDGHKIASTLEGCKNKLSLKNCQAIAILGDKKFSEDEMIEFGTFMGEIDRLNFELPDGSLSHGNINVLFNLWKSLQKTEWDVEIVTETIECECSKQSSWQKVIHCSFSKQIIEKHITFECTKSGIKPKLDADGYLILKRKV